MLDTLNGSLAALFDAVRGPVDPYNPLMVPPDSARPLSADTGPAAERPQIDLWRRMSDAGKLALVQDLNAAADAMALAGIRHRHPSAPLREQFLRLACLKACRRDLATRVYPEIAESERAVTIPGPLGAALLVADVLDGLGIRYTVGGSIASSMTGEPRSTLDVDIVVELRQTDVAAFVARLGDDFYVDEDALRRAVSERLSANLIHHEGRSWTESRA